MFSFFIHSDFLYLINKQDTAMKKIILLFAFIISTSQITFAQQAVEARTTDSRILKQLPAELIKNPIYLKGDLASWVNASNEFIVYAETKEKKYIFILQMDRPRGIKPATGKFTELTFLDNSMVLSDGKAMYYFSIQPLKEDKAAQIAHLTGKDFINMVEGYGLSHHVAPASDKKYSLDKLKGAKSVFHYLEGKK